jgi:hypothetical protein
MINEDLKEVINNLMYALDKDDLKKLLYRELRKLSYNHEMTQEKYFKFDNAFNNLYDVLFKEA